MLVYGKQIVPCFSLKLHRLVQGKRKSDLIIPNAQKLYKLVHGTAKSCHKWAKIVKENF